MESQEIILQVGVKVLLKNPEGKYLLLRRNPLKYPEVGPKWDIVGGRIEPGSPLLDNLRREIKEEINLGYAGEPKLVAAQDILKVPGRHVVRLTFVGEIEGRPQIDSDHLECKWFEAGEIKEMADEVLDSYFKELIDKNVIIL
jgi:ADP-ribose pyrophosphatase YjhB (NUDIX family)